ncbi:MAG: CapA family protein [Oscillospiraceae bacterium]|jgi:poly-gamma-glutamate synthesis protein (capsule biosynthesis protein)|nr:CapA family protein [Oscillospiraceae bacterium]
MAKLKLLLISLLVIPCCLLTSCAGSKAQPDGFTAEYRAFVAARGTDSTDSVQESVDGYRFALENGRLSVGGTDNAEVWRSKGEWYVESFRIGDVNLDGITDFVFVVWKSYSYGAEHPNRMTNDDAAVRCHLFVYSVKDDRVKELWCSSNLPRPIYSFELYTDGEQTPTLSGVRLVAREGNYTEDYSKTVSTEYEYAWNGWGFSPAITSPASVDDSLSATIAFVGDLMCHEAQNQDALSKGGGVYDYSYAFKYISPYITAADYAIGNLETTIIPDGNKPSDFPAFGTPAAFAEAIKAAGFDLMTTANNHALDFGKEGLAHTLRVLDDVGLEHTGTYAIEADSQKTTIINVNGITFAVLSYTYSVNGKPIPQDMPWCVNRTDNIKESIAQAKKLNPDVIIVMPHMGIEYETTTRQIFKDDIYELFQAGADVVLGSHPHVLQQAEFMTIADADGTERECFAAYSLGNFISSQRTAPCDYGMIANLSFKKVGNGKTMIDAVDLVPVWIKFTSPDGSYDITALPVGNSDEPGIAEAVNELSPDDVKRINDVKAEFAEMFSGYA